MAGQPTSLWRVTGVGTFANSLTSLQQAILYIIVILYKYLFSANKAKLEKDGLVVTNPGKLLCQKIIHMKAKSTDASWKSMIYNCLLEVEKLGLNSVTFPALGTGIIRLVEPFPKRQILDSSKLKRVCR